MRNLIALLVALMAMVCAPSVAQPTLIQEPSSHGSSLRGQVLEFNQQSMTVQTFKGEESKFSLNSTPIPSGLKIGETVELKYHTLSVMCRLPDGRKGCRRVKQVKELKRISSYL